MGRPITVSDFRARAKRRLPRPIFDYLDGGADDEWSLANNTRAFETFRLVHHGLVDVARIDAARTVLGARLAMPLLLSPTGMNRLFHRDRERGVARPAARAGVMYALSTLSTVSIEEIGRLTDGPKLFQIYVFKDRGLTEEFVARCRAANFQALCLTIDTPVAGNRERDLRSGMTLPPRLNPLSFAARPAWTLDALRDPDFELANVRDRAQAIRRSGKNIIAYIGEQLDRSVGWADVERLRALWSGPLALKGVAAPGDARQAQALGVDALLLSNHGGRQLDGCVAPIESLPAIRDAVGGRMELIVDGGVRRGTHALKALALGATAVAFGRPYLYALAAQGEAGVDALLASFRAEIERGMALLGCADLSKLGLQHVQRQ